MTNTQELLNKLLVQLFNDILHIEENSLKNIDLMYLSMTEIHTIEAVGIKDAKTMGEIAHDLRITVGTLSAAITKLIKKGYVERKSTEEDRRVVLVSLTSKGENIYREHQVFHEEMITSMLGNFSEEEHILAIALKKLNNFFEEKYEGLK
nr:MarR family transcriptional regulator [uncultured Romboutsia sp.]